MKSSIDHILWAVPDFHTGVALFRDVTGVSAAIGGRHDGFGTRNALASLGGDMYLEVIAPDTEQALEGTLGETLAQLAAPKILTVAFATSDLVEAGRRASDAGAVFDEIVAMGRTRPDGVRLEWEILRFVDDVRRASMPFLIDWKGSANPSATSAEGCALDQFTLLDPDPPGIRALLRAVGADVDIARSAAPGAVATLNTPNGKVILT